MNILVAYPTLSFILIGDSGERDGDIYIEIAKQYPNQIRAIYLRSVNDARRMQLVKELFSEFTQIPFLLVGKTDEAVHHAREHGFIC